jgi:F0F1-type ATP synthase epsilon subunit
MPEEEHITTKAEKKEAAAKAATSTSMHVKVYAPFKVYFDGEATSISAANATGPFDILPQHHNFMTILSPCDIIVRSDQGEEKVTINKGIMHVKADRVVVFLDV